MLTVACNYWEKEEKSRNANHRSSKRDMWYFCLFVCYFFSGTMMHIVDLSYVHKQVCLSKRTVILSMNKTTN